VGFWVGGWGGVGGWGRWVGLDGMGGGVGGPVGGWAVGWWGGWVGGWVVGVVVAAAGGGGGRGGGGGWGGGVGGGGGWGGWRLYLRLPALAEVQVDEGGTRVGQLPAAPVKLQQGVLAPFADATSLLLLLCQPNRAEREGSRGASNEFMREEARGSGEKGAAKEERRAAAVVFLLYVRIPAETKRGNEWCTGDQVSDGTGVRATPLPRASRRPCPAPARRGAPARA